MSIIKTKHLSYHYIRHDEEGNVEGEVPAVKDVNLSVEPGEFIAILGHNGSGKSTLVNETLRPILARELYRSFDQPLEYDGAEGLEHIDKLVVVDQSPIGRTPRSNPATYSNVFSDIRKLFEMTPDAQIRGFKAGRFSFNVKGGRCEECRGAGVQTIEMNFLPDVYVRCKACGGHRYNRETLEVKYKGKNIDDVLNMTVNMAVEFFENIPNIYQKLRAIQEVGLGYLTLGQPCTTLSGGESQRIKLSSELSKRDTGRTLYILDEPFSLQRLAGLLCALSGALLVHHGTVQDKDTTSSDTSRTAS